MAKIKLTAEQQRKRKNRNLALLIVLFGLVGLFYGITMIRLAGGA